LISLKGFFVNLSSHPKVLGTFQRTALMAALITLVSACSVLEEDKVDYKSAAKAPTLEVPPDLTQLRRDSRYALESNSATASGFNSASAKVADAGTAANALGDVKMERQGNQRWLVVAQPADKVWPSLREFWTSNGFTLAIDSPDVGIMETEWAENRAKIPQDAIRKALSKVVDSLYSSGERDKYRTRVERNAQGGVDIYITQRGMVENYANAQKDQFIWQPRANDPELEIEFLRRLMVKLGATPEAAKSANASENAATVATVSTKDGQPTIELSDNLDRAWRRTGVALDRSGFTVEDRDRSQGIFFVRYVTPGNSADKEPGFFSRMFSSKTEANALARYRIALTTQGGATWVRVLDAGGQTESSGNAERILKLLANELR
jgi:outer membrane protein assembly factor BamC